MTRNGSAKWQGNLKEGSGTISTESSCLTNVPYSFAKRFENERGTNPEELIGAAHAACFSMALAGELQKSNFIADSIEVQAAVKLEKQPDGFKISSVHLQVAARIPNCTPKQFLEAATVTKSTCPVSKLLNAEITLESYLLEN